ncbi:MAG: reverse transcriptase domain-containing protein [Bacteroidota bacterium]
MVADDEENNQEETLIEEEGLLSAGENVIMQTALVEAMDGEESCSETTRVLMDTGSSRTYITEELVEKLKLRTEDKNRLTVYTFGGKKPKEMTSPVVTIVLKSKDGNILKVKANVVPKICAQINRHPVHLKDKMKFRRTFRLADTLPTSREASTIGVLIGNDYYNDVMTGERKQVQEGLFVLKSKFGWVVSGRTKSINKQDTESSLFVMTHSSSNILPDIHQVTAADDSLPTPPNLEDFWNLETIGIKPDEPNNADEITIEMFKDTITKEGYRYFISWPWRDEDHDLLPENYELSLGRLKSLAKRLEKDPDLFKRYNEIIQTQAKKGMIEKVNVSDMNNANKKHYIPHHVVVKPESTTTKLRIVYDASAKTKKSNKSLNECLYRGPVIMEDLCGLLLRFRTQKIGIVSDIEKAFLQIGIQKDQRDVTRFLWLKDVTKPVTNDNLQIYRFARVPFGIISSPFLLGATIQHHIKESSTSIARKIKDNIYVDNIITGANSKDEAVELYKNAKDLFRDASMNLREWITSSKEVNNQIAPEDRVEGITTKVLGLNWNTESDELSILAKKFSSTEQASTKREILATIASIYDPLGMMSPTIIKLKIFLQDLWKKDIDWDEPLSEDDREVWLELTKGLNELATIQIPRFIGNEKPQLLGFCDASKKAYATAIYLRTEIDGTPHINLIFAKTRNAPKEKKVKPKKTKKGKAKSQKTKKKMTIPRLELMSALIATRALRFIAKELGLNDKQMMLWTDSKCVLDWLKQKDNKDVFVRNRVNEIIKDNDINFRYINTKHNPADIPTKGMTTEELKISDLWWHGPEWLKKSIDQWPTWDVDQINKDSIERILETKDNETNVIYETSVPASTINRGTEEVIKPPFGIQAEKYSSITKILRITAYANRFVLKTRKMGTAKNHLSAEEIEAATTLWIKYLQKKHYLTRSKGEVTLNKKTSTNQLNPHLYPNGIIRCHSRLTNADLPRDTIEPILLPRNERFVQLMIEDTHRRLFHAGVNHTLSEIRTKYWIPQGRAEVKYVLKRCKICRKHQGGPYKMPAMSPWPKSKLTRSIPFKRTGLDYFGPLYVKQTDGSTQKVWVCLFTCVVVRAIHLEIVNDLTAEEFIMALRRFIARRGKPSHIISDNASQFKLANSTIDLAWNKVITDEAVTSYIANEGIKWSFIVELSPWMGGFYERLVGSSKVALKKAIGQKLLTSIQLQTYLAETEAILNTRPLIYIGEDLNDGTTITPSHFLSPNTKTGTPTLEDQDEIKDPTYVDGKMESKEMLLDTWKKGQRMLELFWKIWKTDYLLNLRERSKSYLSSPRIQAHEKPNVGDIVQLKEATPRGSWKLGKITELITSSDGNVRAAKVLLATRNIVNRSLNLLYPLECENDFTDNLNDENINHNTDTEDARNTQENDIDQTKENEVQPVRRSTRRAAIEARDRIYGQNLTDE